MARLAFAIIFFSALVATETAAKFCWEWCGPVGCTIVCQ